MSQLGFPELHVATASRSQLDRLTFLVNATAQTLLERGDLTRPGELAVDLATLDEPWSVDPIRRDGGTGRLTWSVRWTRGVDHGSDALMLALEPPGGAGAEPLQRALDAFVGAPFDPVAYLSDDDPELLEAGVRARRELEALRARFTRGVPPANSCSSRRRSGRPRAASSGCGSMSCRGEGTRSTACSTTSRCTFPISPWELA
ncbi:MAG: hypothetical protein ACTHU0_39925 [Kofleriaceae bacterium]